MQKTLFFDLYFTLIVPAVIPGRNEWDYLGITQPEWNAFAETEERCALADSGAIETRRSLTEEIARWGNLSLSDEDLDELTRRRIERFRATLMDVGRQTPGDAHGADHLPPPQREAGAGAPSALCRCGDRQLCRSAQGAGNFITFLLQRRNAP